MMRTIILVLMTVLLTATLAAADPKSTQSALTLLFTEANAKIPPSSSCMGDYGQQGDVRIRDLLAMGLSFFIRGKNTIVGSCQGKRSKKCSLLIRHELVEGYAAEINFTAKEGKVDVSSLTCVITP